MTVFQNEMGEHQADPCSRDQEITTEQQGFITDSSSLVYGYKANQTSRGTSLQKPRVIISAP